MLGKAVAVRCRVLGQVHSLAFPPGPALYPLMLMVLGAHLVLEGLKQVWAVRGNAGSLPEGSFRYGGSETELAHVYEDLVTIPDNGT